jgi:hypothetical protein
VGDDSASSSNSIDYFRGISVLTVGVSARTLVACRLVESLFEAFGSSTVKVDE